MDFATADRDAYRRAGEGLLATGVTAFQPTLITAPERDLVPALAAVPREPSGPRILGAHLEGPFLSPYRLCATPPLRGAIRTRRCSSGCSRRGRSPRSRWRRSSRAWPR